jgi:hypothetical protein
MKISKKISITGLLITVAVLSCFLFSCRKASEKASEKMMEKAIENATGGKADVELGGEKVEITTSDGTFEMDGKAQSWPDEIPDDVPEFTYGKVKAVTTSTIDGVKSWNVIYEKLEDGFVDNYDSDLKEKGFETVTMKMGDNAGSITAENEKYNIFLMGSEGTLSIAVSLKQEE